MSAERTHAGPRSRVPTAISVEPPPTSQTATTPETSPARASAPAKANRPSSSALSTPTGRRVASSSLATSACELAAWRPGAVTKVSIRSTPSRRASRA